ncbi:XRE family transcriptional regulator [Dokdonella sp. MW10]|uniref:XRE family transcriptional regulator n=1 Tax=Dokdonella sp. MW10 TaxID=2992926 RepID=UPI003F81C1A7
MDDPARSTAGDPVRTTMVDMESLGERLRAERKAQNRTQADVGRAAGVSKQAIAKIESGGTQDPGATTLEPIARLLNVTVRWLTTGKLPKHPPDVASEDWSDILAFKTAAALGDGALPDEYAETHALKFRAASLQRKRLRPDRLGVCYGRGDSMLPRIRSGDAILFDMSDNTPKDGALFVVSYDGHLMAKRLTLLGGRWFIESLNRDDPKWAKPIPIDEHKGFEVHGRVRWVGSWED